MSILAAIEILIGRNTLTAKNRQKFTAMCVNRVLLLPSFPILKDSKAGVGKGWMRAKPGLPVV